MIRWSPLCFSKSMSLTFGFRISYHIQEQITDSMGLQLSPSGGSRWEASDSGLLESGRAVIITFYFPEVGEHMPVGWRFALLYSLLLALTSHHLGAAQESRGRDDPLPWSTWGLPSLDNWTAGNKARKRMRLGWCRPTRLPPLLPHLPCSGWLVLYHEVQIIRTQESA